MRAKVVYAELSLWTGRGRSVVSRGQRAIAKAVGMSKESVRKALLELERAQHIEIWKKKHGEFGRGRSQYLMRSPVYWGREVKAEGPGGEVVAARVDDGILQRRWERERRGA